jgi:hypothetical protein
MTTGDQRWKQLRAHLEVATDAVLNRDPPPPRDVMASVIAEDPRERAEGSPPDVVAGLVALGGVGLADVHVVAAVAVHVLRALRRRD